MAANGSIDLARVSGRYFARWKDEGGEWKRRSLGTDDLQVARAALVEFKRVFSLAVAGEPLTVGEVFLAYHQDRAEAGKPAAARILDAWKKLKPHFDKLMPNQINEDVCKPYIKERRAAGRSDGTIHTELGYLRSALHFGSKRKKWYGECYYVPLPTKPPPKDHYLTKPEARRLLEAAVMPHMKLVIVLALSTAARIGALLDLTWDRVDFERRKIMLHNPDRAVTPKGRATVPINDMAYEMLMEMRSGAVSPYVIEWGGKKVGSVKRGIVRAGERSGLKVSPHVLRHTAAVWMVEGGISMEEVSQYLGHRDIQTTRRIYARYSPEHLRGAAKALHF